MKRHLLLSLAILPLMALCQTMSVSEFYLDEKDLTATNEETKMIDDNGQVCALIRIETTQKGFTFDGGTVGVVEAIEKVGEIWLYVPAGLRRITIRHQQLGTLRDFYFPETLQPARTYVMKLVSGTTETVVTQKASNQWLVLNYEPKNALVEIDGVITEGNDGQLMQKLSRGKHNVRISAKNYHTEVLIVELSDEKVSKTVNLNPAFGWIEVKGPNGASVYIDNEKIGEAPIKSQPIPSGNHDLRVAKENWLPYRNQVLVNDNTVVTVNPQLTANFVTVTLTTDNDAEIWVDDVKRGNGTVTVELSPKEYTFESRKPGHKSQSIAREITLSTEGVINIPAPVAMVGILSIEVNPVGARIYIDDKYVGESPLILDNILVGQHQVKTVYEGLQEEKRTLEIREGETSELILSMSRPTTTKYPGVVIENGVLKKVPTDFKGDFIIGEEITSIGEKAFEGCNGLTGVTIPNSVTSIGYAAFELCTGLTNVTIPNSVTYIGLAAFSLCTRLTSVILPNNIKNIAQSTFADCSHLTNVQIPNGVTSIGKFAFSSCESLTSLTIPSGVTSIEERAFDKCKSLTSLTLPNGVTRIDYCAFDGCTGLISLTLPNTLKTIGEMSFCKCSNIKNLTIPNGVTTIGKFAFSGCKGLTSITLPKSLVNVGNYAFCECSGLISVTILNNTLRFMDDSSNGVFSKCDALSVIYVPAGSINHYKHQLQRVENIIVEQ